MKARTKSRIALSAAVVLLAVAAVLGGSLLSWRQAAQTPPSPGPTETADSQEEAAAKSDGFPVVDWDYWKGVNPAIIGWITIPGTTINLPILQAPADAPTYYLKHDVYGNYNPHGAIYLDADCPDGLLSKNAVIMGHHFGNDVEAAPFGTIASYTDKGFAERHATVYIQTPEWKKTYGVRFAEIVNGLEPTKRTTFSGEDDYRSWYDSSRDGAAMVLDGTTEPDQTISLVTCSYNIWVQNERTVLVTSENGTQNQAKIAETSSAAS